MNLRILIALGIILFLIVVLRDKIGLGEKFCKWFGMDAGGRECVDGVLQPAVSGNGGGGGGPAQPSDEPTWPPADDSDEPLPPWISGPSIPDRLPSPDPITDAAYVEREDCITYYLREDPYSYATRPVMVPVAAEPGYEDHNLTFDDLGQGVGMDFSTPFVIADGQDRIPVDASAMPDWKSVLGVVSGVRYTMYLLLFRYFGDVNAIVTAFRQAEFDDFAGTHINLPHSVPLITPFDAMFVKEQPGSIASFFDESQRASNVYHYEQMGNIWDELISKGIDGTGAQYTPLYDWLSSYITTLEDGKDSAGRDLSVMGKPRSYGVVDNGRVLAPLGGLDDLQTPRGPWRLALRPVIVELFAGTLPLVDESTATKRFLGDAKWIRLHRRYDNLWRLAFGISYTRVALGLMNRMQVDLINGGSFSAFMYQIANQVAFDQTSPDTMLELLRYVLFWLTGPTYDPDQSLCEGAA